MKIKIKNNFNFYKLKKKWRNGFVCSKCLKWINKKVFWEDTGEFYQPLCKECKEKK